MRVNTAYDKNSDRVFDWSHYLFENAGDLFGWKLKFCNRGNLINVEWGDWKITESPKKTLGTWGLFDCVGLAASVDTGQRKRRFLAHMLATPENVRKNFDGFYRFMDGIREPNTIKVALDSTASFTKPFLLDEGTEVVILDCLKQIFGEKKEIPLYRSVTIVMRPDGQIVTDERFEPATIIL